MTRKHSTPNDCETDREPVGGPARNEHLVLLEKQYQELCVLRQQVQIEESRQRVGSALQMKNPPA